MLPPDHYRSLAADMRAEAETSPLEQVRARAERAARAWTEIADQIDATEACKLRNAG